MGRFTYEPGMPLAVKREIVRALKPYEWLVPDWCQEVFVMWSAHGGDGSIVITSSSAYEYRRVTLTFYPPFLSEEGNRAEHVIHDLLHAFVSVVSDYAYEVIDRLVSEEEAPKFRQTLLEELRVRNESCVQDLAHCVAKHLTT